MVFFWSGKVSSFLVALNRPDRWGLSVLCEWTNLRCHRRGSREGAQQFCSGYFYSEQFHPPFPIGLTAHQCAGESKSVCCVSDWREQVLFRFFSPTFVFALGFFSPFVLIKEGSGMCPVCTVYYRHRPAGTLVLLGFPAPVPGSTLIPSDLAWQRQEVQKKGGHCSRKVRAKVEKQHVEIFSYLIKTQNASVSIFPALALASFLSLKNHLPRTPHLAWWQP